MRKSNNEGKITSTEKELSSKEQAIVITLTFRSCHEAEEGKPVTKTAYKGIIRLTEHSNSLPNYKDGLESYTYHDSQSAWKAHGYCSHCNYYNDPQMMKVFAHHEQVQPKNKES